MRDHAWLMRVWALALAFTAFAALRSLQIGIPLRDPRGSILVSRVAISAGLFAILVVLDAALRVRRGHRPWAALWPTVRDRWPAGRLAVAWSGLLAYHLVYFSYHNLKSWDVFNAPRDEMLLRWDRAAFLGHSPAVLLHDLLGQHWAMYALTFVYESFSTIVTVSFVAALVLVDRLRDGMVMIASMLWVWILGVACYYLIPSLGPFDVAPQEFSGLAHTLVQDTQVRYMAQRAHLLADPQAPDAFAQVSAFASLHVAVTFVILLMARYYGLRRTTLALWVFLAGTIVATVYLGWHYVSDDVAGLAIAWLAVALGRRMVEPQGRRKAAPVLEGAR